MTSPPDPSDRFGIPDQRIIEVIRAHPGLIRDGCYVPTRREVAEAPAEKLWNWLLGWWWESPTELIPTDAQVADVIAILLARPDAANAEIQRIIAQAPPPDNEWEGRGPLAAVVSRKRGQELAERKDENPHATIELGRRALRTERPKL